MENHLFNYYKLRSLYHRLQCNKQPLASLCNGPQSFTYCTYVSSLGVVASLYEPGCDTKQHSSHLQLATTAEKHHVTTDYPESDVYGRNTGFQVGLHCRHIHVKNYILFLKLCNQDASLKCCAICSDR